MDPGAGCCFSQYEIPPVWKARVAAANGVKLLPKSARFARKAPCRIRFVSHPIGYTLGTFHRR
jgi:hypothetical protein